METNNEENIKPEEETKGDGVTPYPEVMEKLEKEMLSASDYLKF